MARKLSTPAEVFEECLLDIRDGLWICDALSKNNESCTHVEKPMGCGIGLIGINTGDCTWELMRNESFDFIVVETWNEDEMYAWSDLAQKCGVILAKAALIINPKRFSVYEDENGLRGEDREEVLAYYDKHVIVADAQEIIINYNDGGIRKDDADAWFSKALEMAQQER
jgi:hypothetical protein